MEIISKTVVVDCLDDSMVVITVCIPIGSKVSDSSWVYLDFQGDGWGDDSFHRFFDFHELAEKFPSCTSDVIEILLSMIVENFEALQERRK